MPGVCSIYQHTAETFDSFSERKKAAGTLKEGNSLALL
jgi:hypothetical protein